MALGSGLRWSVRQLSKGVAHEGTVSLGHHWALSLGLCASSAALADLAPSPSAQAEATLDVATVLRQTRELERAPASADAEQRRMGLARWLQDTKDYLVLVCDILPLP